MEGLVLKPAHSQKALSSCHDTAAHDANITFDELLFRRETISCYLGLGFKNLLKYIKWVLMLIFLINLRTTAYSFKNGSFLLLDENLLILKKKSEF